MAKLWATVNALQDKYIQNQNNASAFQGQIPAARNIGIQTENVDLSTRHPPADFENHLMDDRSNQKAKFENIKPHLGKRTTKRNKSHQADTKDLEQKIKNILGLQLISRDVADNVSHPRRLDPTMELITYSFVLYLQHGRHDVKWKPSIEQENESLKTIMQIREDEYKQAQNEKDNENHRPLQIIQPKQTINLKNNTVTAVSRDSRTPKFEMLDINNCF